MSVYLHRLSDAKAEESLAYATLHGAMSSQDDDAHRATLWAAAKLAGYLADRAKAGHLSRRRARRLCRVLVGVSRAEFGVLLRMVPRQFSLRLEITP